MQKFIAAICVIPLFIICCRSGPKEKKGAEATNNIGQAIADSGKETQSFFPVNDFLLGQLKATDSLPVTPLKITINGSRHDSTWLKKNDIRKFAFPFLHPAIDSVSLSRYFTEKSFMDQTINAVTLSYDATADLPDSIKLNHWDVYIDPQRNTVKRIYLVKEESSHGASITTQLTWKADKWCSIRTITQQEGKDPQVKEEIMKWDFDE